MGRTLSPARFRRLVLISIAFWFLPGAARAQTGPDVITGHLGGVNDTPQHARDLCAIAKRMRSHVNLLLYNRVDGLEFQRPVDTDVQRFLAVLRERGVNAHLRKSRGLDVDAACGQLRRRTLEDSA